MTLIVNLYLDYRNTSSPAVSRAGVLSTVARDRQLATAGGTVAPAGFANPVRVTMDARGIFMPWQSPLIREILGIGCSISPALPAVVSFNTATGDDVWQRASGGTANYDPGHQAAANFPAEPRDTAGALVLLLSAISSF